MSEVDGDLGDGEELTEDEKATKALEKARDAWNAREWPHVIELKHPIELKHSTITKLTFRRPRMGDMRGVNLSGAMSFDSIMTVAGRICGETSAVMAKIDADDVAEVTAIGLGFIGRCLAG